MKGTSRFPRTTIAHRRLFVIGATGCEPALLTHWPSVGARYILPFGGSANGFAFSRKAVLECGDNDAKRLSPLSEGDNNAPLGAFVAGDGAAIAKAR